MLQGQIENMGGQLAELQARNEEAVASAQPMNTSFSSQNEEEIERVLFHFSALDNPVKVRKTKTDKFFNELGENR